MKRFAGFASRLAAIVAAVFAGAYSWKSDVVQNSLPQPPQSAAVKVFGTQETIQGTEAFFHVDTTGKTGTPVWRLIPPTANALVVFPDGKKARFQSNTPGPYSLVVAVAGEGGDAVMDSIEFHNDAIEEPQPEVVETAAEHRTMTVAELVGDALRTVPVENRPHDMPVVAGSIRQLIGRIESGLLPPDASATAELKQQIAAALSDRAEGWHGFVEGLETIIETLRRQGSVTTVGSTVPTLNEAAGVLESQ